MRRIKHLTPRFIKNRILLSLYELRNPAAPWLTPAANAIMESLLKPTDCMLEFGSGRSSVWFAERVSHITSVEHNVGWAEKVRRRLAERSLNNAELVLVPVEDERSPKAFEPYVMVSDRFAPDSLDIVLVDGALRSQCVQAVMPKIRPGGVLIIDNANWYLPSKTRSPSSRCLEAGPADTTWAGILADLRAWRSIWTSSGVTDTALYFKPAYG
jgi:hypothetical protein